MAAEEDATFDQVSNTKHQTADVNKDQSRKQDGDGAGVAKKASDQGEHLKIPVNEDYLFDVDIQDRELAPAYWLGPVYEVRRGTWFYQGQSSIGHREREQHH